MTESYFSLSSPEFSVLGPIPRRYSAQGANISPPLRWSGAPRDTVELALICEDPDAPFPKPFVHWIIYGLPATVSSLPEGLPGKEELEFPVLARQGRNSMQTLGFTGPNPPFWHGAHHYIFKLYALNKPIELWPGATREEFLKAIQGAVLAQTRLVGVYEKPPAHKLRAALLWLGAGTSMVGAWQAARLIAKRKRIRGSELHSKGGSGTIEASAPPTG